MQGPPRLPREYRIAPDQLDAFHNLQNNLIGAIGGNGIETMDTMISIVDGFRQDMEDTPVEEMVETTESPERAFEHVFRNRHRNNVPNDVLEAMAARFNEHYAGAVNPDDSTTEIYLNILLALLTTAGLILSEANTATFSQDID